MALQKSLEWSCTVDWVISIVDDVLFCSISHAKLNLFCLKTFFQIIHQQVNDIADILSGQWFIENDLVQTV